MSMGAIILAGGAADKRAILPNGRVLIHQPTGAFQGQSSDIEIHAREALAVRERLEEILATHTGQERERVHADMERDNFMTPSEAVSYRIVDRVLRDRGRENGRRRAGIA